MEYSSSSQFMDLPDEILTFILIRLNIIDVLKLFGINKRLDNILCDHEVTNNLKLFRWSSNGDIYPLDNKMLDFLCLKILPKIYNHVKSLNMEVSSIKRIIRSAYYPNLCKIALYNIDINSAMYLFNNNPSSLNMYNTKIASMVITSVLRD